MQSNFLHMITIILAFIVVNLFFMAILFFYRKYQGGILCKLSPAFENYVLHENFLKLCFIFSAVYFIVFILSQHTRIHCNMLDKAAQPQCDVLEGVVPPRVQRSSFSLPDALVHKQMMPTVPIDFTGLHGVQMHQNCQQFTDLTVNGEHFIETQAVKLPPGTHYFVFEAMPTKTETFVYMIGEKVSFIFPWLNATGAAWSKLGEDNSIEPIFFQAIKASETSEKLMIVLNSTMDQTIQLRLQHAESGRGDYDGKRGNTTNLCKAEIGQLTG